MVAGRMGATLVVVVASLAWYPPALLPTLVDTPLLFSFNNNNNGCDDGANDGGTNDDDCRSLGLRSTRPSCAGCSRPGTWRYWWRSRRR
jgi:hypothetical protein